MTEILVSRQTFSGVFFQQLGVKLKFSTSNHPQTDGQSERTSRSIAQLLHSVVDHRQGNWEEMLPICEFAFNNQVQASSNETPFYLNYGLHPQSVADISLSAEQSQTSSGDSKEWLEHKRRALVIARDFLQQAAVRQSKAANSTRQERVFSVGQEVMVHRDFIGRFARRDHPNAKLRPRWFGPFKIIELPSSSTAKLALPATIRVHPVFNTSALMPYVPSDSTSRVELPPPPVIDADGNERFVVECVLSQRVRNKKKQFCVKWKGYDETTWEPREYLLDEAGHPIIPLQNFLNRL